MTHKKVAYKWNIIFALDRFYRFKVSPSSQFRVSSSMGAKQRSNIERCRNIKINWGKIGTNRKTTNSTNLPIGKIMIYFQRVLASSQLVQALAKVLFFFMHWHLMWNFWFSNTYIKSFHTTIFWFTKKKK